MSASSNPAARRAVWTAVIVLAVLHHDFWWWEDKTLVLGFLPIGLFYHVIFSLLAAGIWALAVKFAWPDHIEEWASEFDHSHAANEAVPGQEEARS